MSEHIVTTEMHFFRLSDEAARDAIRQACTEAKDGPVWLVNELGDRLGAIVAPDDAETLMDLTRPLDGTDHGPVPGTGVGC